MKTFLQQHKQTFPWVVMIVLFSGMGLILWFGILPFQRFIVEKADSIQEYYATQENRERQIKKLPELEEQFKSIVADEQTLDILLSESEIVDFVKTLERLAEETKTHITLQAKDGNAIQDKKNSKPKAKSVAVLPIDDEDTKKTAPASILDAAPYDRYLHVNVAVIGEYRDVVTFLHKMETLPLGLDVIGMSIKLRDKETEEKQPSNPGRNPFLIFGGGTLVPSEAAPAEGLAEEVILGSLEATFDTIVYVNSK